MYDTYRFKDKDPIIDVLRTAIQGYAEIEGKSWHKTLKYIEYTSGIRAATMYNWFNGPTISPRYASVAAVVNALHISLQIGDRKYNIQRLRLVKQ